MNKFYIDKQLSLEKRLSEILAQNQCKPEDATLLYFEGKLDYPHAVTIRKEKSVLLAFKYRAL